MPEYLYVRSNPEWENKFKFGYTSTEKGLVDRYLASITEHSDYSSYENIFEIKKEKSYLQEYREFDKILSIACRSRKFSSEYPLLDSFYPFLIEGRVRNEFMKKEGLETLEKIVRDEFPKFGLSLIKSFSRDECNEVVEKAKSQISEDYKQLVNKDNFQPRDYQSKIIEDLQSYLLKDGRAFLELATGGGKSFIVYNLFKIIKSECIIIFSPRKKINSQNIAEKYINILDESIDVIHYDNLRKCKCERSIIVSCIQSVEKIYRFIQDSNLHDIFVWFDEAHHTIENWGGMKEEKEYIKFFLSDQERIKYRIFTSASPNEEKLRKYNNVFGVHYKPIKVSELIRDKWLCDLSPYVFDIGNPTKGDINHFIENNFDKNWGLSFHSKRVNAYSLFEIHLKNYKKEKTNIVPFLLLGDDYDSSGIDPFFLKLENFEKTKNSIGYVVQKYSMGYDFHNIDFIIFSDPKSSYQDIVQCIGRGLRSDKFESYGKNKSKTLKVMIPSYHENGKENDYSKVISVLDYIIDEAGVDWEIIENNRPRAGSGHFSPSEDYAGEKIQARYLDIKKSRGISLKRLVSVLKEEKIYTVKEYTRLLKDRKDLCFPKNPVSYYNKKFYWNMVCPFELYYNKKDCIDSIRRILSENDSFVYEKEDEDERQTYLNNLDKKIPDRFLVAFYGGTREEFLIYD